jgi:AcrR family transcriptional regulator
MLAAAKEDLSRRERRKLEVRERILEAAAGLFDEQGFHAAKVGDICTRADVADKTFFNHFQNKQGLLRELANHAVDQLVGEIEAARAGKRTTRERLLAFFAQVARNAEAAGPMHRELLTELVHAVHGSPSKSENAHKLHTAFAAIVRDGLAAGEVTRRHDTATLTQIILGAFYVLMFDFANLESFPIRKQSLSVARFLADALAPAQEE